MQGTPERRGRGRAALLWILAFVLMASAGVYQRYTGPTRELRGAYTVGDEAVSYRLIRSAYSTGDAVVSLRAPTGVLGELVYRRYPTEDEFTRTPLERRAEQLVGRLPAQPPAGKLEYHLELRTDTGTIIVPSTGQNVVIRFKGEVPLALLIAHVSFMFVGVLVAWRAGLEAVFGGPGLKPLSWTALILFTIGGMILGPLVQRYAFGELWTGIPFGWDLTDNKTLIMWLAWMFALLALARTGAYDPTGQDADRARKGRFAVLAAAVVTVAVYLIPHSMAGSQLDYDAVDRGVAPEDAIGIG